MANIDPQGNVYPCQFARSPEFLVGNVREKPFSELWADALNPVLARFRERPVPLTGPVLIIAEGLFMYLHEGEVRSLLLRLQQKFPGSLLVFDCFSADAVKRMAAHPSIQKTGAGIYWGIDNAAEIGQWNKGISLLEEWYFTQSDEIRKLDRVYRMLFTIAGLFSAAKKAHLILVFRLD
ncbi:MAG: SPASM domain-containing protein [Methanoregula sp.]|uniref:SPASM domain-containing protein n=1 Tax=Methanoregula sp. TaxID=2052170 RepID=UPI0025F2BCE4|nr:SPASM domain-containing protein [Methanoregula sp.]MCK9632014.1 SPASM domain-containing protein [Methanoregula sp.]